MTGAGAREHLRAAAIGLVLLAHGIYALPLPPAYSERRIREPGFQEDIDVWMGIFDAVGLPVERGWFQDTVVDVSRQLHGLHVALKAPFAPAMDLVGANQAWALFASTTTTPDRLEVSMRLRGEDGWRVLMRRLDPCCTYFEPQLAYRRVRGVWDGQRDAPRAGYKGLTKWLANRIFEEFPEAEHVRVRLLRERIALPGEAPAAAEVEIKHERVHRRDGP